MNRAKIFITFTLLLAFAVCISAQKPKTTRGLDNLDLINMSSQSKNSESGIVTPNELEGYEFFKSGKLKQLRIGFSTKADVAKIFGSACEKPCQYDANWRITFDYFSATEVLVKNLNKTDEKNYVPRKEAVGKIQEVRIRPMNQISFQNVTFPANLKKYNYSETGYSRPEIRDGVEFDIYADSFGLQYLIFDKLAGDKSKFTLDSRKQFSNFRQGDLIIIKYTITEEMENNFYVEEK
jgi:hypothetical protein